MKAFRLVDEHGVKHRIDATDMRMALLVWEQRISPHLDAGVCVAIKEIQPREDNE